MVASSKGVTKMVTPLWPLIRCHIGGLASILWQRRRYHKQRRRRSAAFPSIRAKPGFPLPSSD